MWKYLKTASKIPEKAILCNLRGIPFKNVLRDFPIPQLDSELKMTVMFLAVNLA